MPSFVTSPSADSVALPPGGRGFSGLVLARFEGLPPLQTGRTPDGSVAYASGGDGTALMFEAHEIEAGAASPSDPLVLGRLTIAPAPLPPVPSVELHLSALLATCATPLWLTALQLPLCDVDWSGGRQPRLFQRDWEGRSEPVEPWRLEEPQADSPWRLGLIRLTIPLRADGPDWHVALGLRLRRAPSTERHAAARISPVPPLGASPDSRLSRNGYSGV